VQLIPHEAASSRRFDAVLIGGGFSAAILAKALSGRGRSVLMIEAGEGGADPSVEFAAYLQQFYTAVAKIPNSPYPSLANAPHPMETDVRPIHSGKPNTNGYFVQAGPSAFQSTYTRRLGGTSLHWFGSCPRMLPEDFQMKSRFGVGVDWPIDYAELVSHYAANIQDFTEYSTQDPGYFEANGRGYSWSGVGHVAGTHVMGTTARNSVVNDRQKSWEHDNLYIVGCGSFPTLGTSNPSLTMTALNLRTAESIERDLCS
jgi:choline dehydrogenase-like flavoprotein